MADTYESLDFKVTHAGCSIFFPQGAGLILDVGAGSGRGRGSACRHGIRGRRGGAQFVNVGAKGRCGMQIRAFDGLMIALPALDATHRTGLAFDLILLSGVWQHVSPADRPRAFRKLVRLLKPGGVLAITLRMGAAAPEREMYQVSQAEIESLARGHGAFVERCVEAEDSLGRSDVHWIQVACDLPDDGTGALPLLRHVVLQDAKSSTYKLALLRSVARIADGAAGLVRESGADHVSVPLGVVALYWTRLYLPRTVRTIFPSRPTNRGLSKLGFVNHGFRRLLGCSPNDLRVGTRYGADLGASCMRPSRAPAGRLRHCRHII
jgi:SAM-dependent methyltransferase